MQNIIMRRGQIEVIFWQQQKKKLKDAVRDSADKRVVERAVKCIQSHAIIKRIDHARASITITLQAQDTQAVTDALAGISRSGITQLQRHNAQVHPVIQHVITQACALLSSRHDTAPATSLAAGITTITVCTGPVQPICIREPATVAVPKEDLLIPQVITITPPPGTPNVSLTDAVVPQHPRIAPPTENAPTPQSQAIDILRSVRESCPTIAVVLQQSSSDFAQLIHHQDPQRCLTNLQSLGADPECNTPIADLLAPVGPASTELFRALCNSLPTLSLPRVAEEPQPDTAMGEFTRTLAAEWNRMMEQLSSGRSSSAVCKMLLDMIFQSAMQALCIHRFCTAEDANLYFPLHYRDRDAKAKGDTGEKGAEQEIHSAQERWEAYLKIMKTHWVDTTQPPLSDLSQLTLRRMFDGLWTIHHLWVFSVDTGPLALPRLRIRPGKIPCPFAAVVTPPQRQVEVAEHHVTVTQDSADDDSTRFSFVTRCNLGDIPMMQVETYIDDRRQFSMWRLNQQTPVSAPGGFVALRTCLPDDLRRLHEVCATLDAFSAHAVLCVQEDCDISRAGPDLQEQGLRPLFIHEPGKVVLCLPQQARSSYPELFCLDEDDEDDLTVPAEMLATLGIDGPYLIADAEGVIKPDEEPEQPEVDHYAIVDAFLRGHKDFTADQVLEIFREATVVKRRGTKHHEALRPDGHVVTLRPGVLQRLHGGLEAQDLRQILLGDPGHNVPPLEDLSQVVQWIEQCKK